MKPIRTLAGVIYMADEVNVRVAELEREVRDLESALRYVMSDADRGFGMPDAVKQTIASLGVCSARLSETEGVGDK